MRALARVPKKVNSPTGEVVDKSKEIFKREVMAERVKNRREKWLNDISKNEEFVKGKF